MPVELSDWEIRVGATIEMDGLFCDQWVRFPIASGRTRASLRDRVLLVLGAGLAHIVDEYAKELDVEVGDYPYRIHEILGFSIRPRGASRWIEMTDTDNDWFDAERLVFRERIAWVMEAQEAGG